MKKTINILFCFLLLTAIACNKDPENPSPSGYHAIFVASIHTGMLLSLPVYQEDAGAIFFSAPGSNTWVNAGTVKLNDTELDSDTVGGYYSFLLEPADEEIFNWSVSGSDDVPAFTFNHSGPYPNYADPLPDTIIRANGVSFSFGGGSVSGADSVLIRIQSGPYKIEKTYSISVGSVTFTPADLSPLSVSDNKNAFIEMFFSKGILHNVGSKSFYFRKESHTFKNFTVL